MGQKLVSIKCEKGSSQVFWNPKYNPNFKLEVSEDGTSYVPVTNYYPKTTDPVNFPADTVTVRPLTDEVFQKAIQFNKQISFGVSDTIAFWRVQVRDQFITGGQWEILASGSLVL